MTDITPAASLVETKEPTTLEVYQQEQQKLSQQFFELGRAHHMLELQKSDVAEWETKCRNQNKKMAEVYTKLQKEQQAEKHLSMAPAIEATKDALNVS